MAQKAGTILIVDDDQDILTAGKLLLKRHFARVLTTNAPDHIPTLLADNSVDTILLDMNFGPGESSGAEGFFWLKRIQQLDQDAVIVMITAHGSVDMAVEALKDGATDFIAKPWQNEKVVATLTAAVKLRQSRAEVTQLRHTNQVLAAPAPAQDQAMIGTSAAITSVHQMISRAAPTDANVLILGENGTGKELAARALHSQSLRAEKPFMSVDLGAVAENLFESELFGHKKGAFTDARTDRIGRIQAAEGGTLFLDEVGNLPLHLQAKLLTVLEQRMVTPVGSDRATPVDVRVIAATNMPRAQLTDENHFRQDLLFRLNTVELLLPPLRERLDDIDVLAGHFTQIYARKYNRQPKRLSAEVIAHLKQDRWAGNIRALRHAIERAMILCDGDSFSTADFPLSQPVATPPHADATTTDTHVGDDLNLDRLEARTIKTALTQHQYNISRAAKALGLTRAALYRRMEKYEL